LHAMDHQSLSSKRAVLPTFSQARTRRLHMKGGLSA
jgi:hypothetical protein